MRPLRFSPLPLATLVGCAASSTSPHLSAPPDPSSVQVRDGGAPPAEIMPDAGEADAWPSGRPSDIDLSSVTGQLVVATKLVKHMCPLPEHQGRSLVKFELSPSDGRVTRAWFEYSPYPDTPTGDCVLKIVSRIRARAPFSGPPFQMGCDFTVGTDPGTNATYGNFDHKGAAAATDAAVRDAGSCLLAGSKPEHVRVVVSRTGAVVAVEVDSVGTEAECVKHRLRALRVPPYVGLDVTLERDVAWSH